jgi:NitT/TauT family transport system substrate-binding protein
MHAGQSRRDFLATAATVVLLPSRGTLADDGPPETTSIRLSKIPGICIAPQYAAEDLLRAEGFSDVRYIATDPGLGPSESVARGEIDFILNFTPLLLIPMDGSRSITVLAGVHPGCFELFATEGIRGILDLKGKSVGVQGVGSTPHVFLAVMASYVGLDPVNDINWVTTQTARPKELFVEGKIDAFLGFPPEPQELRERGIGHVILNSTVDRPWSQYFCCLLAGNTDFIRQNPIATKRVVRAIIKATERCVAEPERVAQSLVDGGFTPRYDYALQALSEVPYGAWRDYSPEDTLRFYALRLHEAGMITGTPQQIIAGGTDWTFLNALKRELKA